MQGAWAKPKSLRVTLHDKGLRVRDESGKNIVPHPTFAGNYLVASGLSAWPGCRITNRSGSDGAGGDIPGSGVGQPKLIIPEGVMMAESAPAYGDNYKRSLELSSSDMSGVNTCPDDARLEWVKEAVGELQRARSKPLKMKPPSALKSASRQRIRKRGRGWRDMQTGPI